MSALPDVALSKGSHSKSKRSFISRLPSFRKKKTTPARESELDMHLRSAEEDLTGSVKIRPPSQVRNRKDDNGKRSSKTSSIVASYEKRLSDLKDEENRTNGKKNGGSKTATFGNSSKAMQQDGTIKTPQKSSRFGFGFAWQKITSFENGNGKKTAAAMSDNGEEVNANANRNIGCSVKSRNLDLQLPHGSPPERESTSSVRTPESDRSSCSSNSSFKVYGQPMPYRSVFSDEPRGIKRQASSSQSEGLNSSGISLSSAASPLRDIKASTATTTTALNGTTDNRLQPNLLNRTFTKDNGGSTNLDRTYSIEESPTCIVNRTFKLEPEEHSTGKTESIVKQELHVAKEAPGKVGKENPISCTREAPSSTAVKNICDTSHESAILSKALDEVIPPKQDVSRPSASSAIAIPKDINAGYIKNSYTDPSVYISPRHRLTSNTMGAVQSSADTFSTPARPVELSLHLRNPHISAIKHCSESLDSCECELDSLCSEDLMCDSRYLDDDMFDSRDESCLLNRSLSVEETAAMHRVQHGWTGRARAVSVDQLPSANCSLEKRVGVTRGLAPSPLGIPPGRRGGRNYPAHPVPEEACRSPVEELQLLINSSSYRDADRSKNGNANSSRVRSQSGGNGHPLRPPRWPSFPPEDDGAVLVDAVVYRHMIQDMTSVKTMLLKLKRSLQAVDNSSSLFEHTLASPCSSLPTSPMSEVSPLQEEIVEDLKEENQVLRKEVKSLQELLADTQHQLKELQVQQASPKQHDASTQCVNETKSKSFQVNIQPPGGQSKEKLPTMTSRQSSPLKVGHSPTSPEPPTDLASLGKHMEVSPPESRRRPRSTEALPPGQCSSEWEKNSTSPKARKTPKARKSPKSKSSSPTITDNGLHSHDSAIPQNSSSYSHDAAANQESQNMPSSPGHKGKPPLAVNQNIKPSGLKKRVSRSKLIQPASYKTKASGSQDSLQSDGSQPDEGRQPTEDRRGGPLKRQLMYSQAPKNAQSGRQASLEFQQKNIKEVNGSTDGIPKLKEIRMMTSQQPPGKSLKVTPGQVQNDTPLQVDQGENGGLPASKLPSLLRMPKMATAIKQELPTNYRGPTERQPQLIDANSNPVPQQNGIPSKMSGLQQPQTTRITEQSLTTDQRQPKVVSIPAGPVGRGKQLPELANSRSSQSPERDTSEEEKISPPSSPRSRGQPSSKITAQVRGRGASRLPRGSGIPTRRTNNS